MTQSEKDTKRVSTWEKLRIPIYIIVIFLVLLQFKKCLRDDQAVTQTQITSVLDSTLNYVDKYNREHAEKVELQADLRVIKSLYVNLLEQKAGELGTKSKNITSVTNFSTQRNLNLDSLIALYSNKDTARKDSIVYRLKPVYVPINDSLSVSTHNKKYGFLNLKSRPMVDIVSYSQGSTSINSITSVRVKQYQNNITIGPSVSFVPTANGWRVLPGVSVQYALFGLYVGKRK